MKKWIIGAVLASTVWQVQAADMTQQEFVAMEKAKWAQKGWTWNQDRVESNFKTMDLNKDGLASGKERQTWYARKKAEQGGAAPQPKAAAKAAPTKTDATDKTKAEFVAQEKAKWAQKGWVWNQAKVEANFDKMDVNHDGLASGQERQAWYRRLAK